MESTGEHDMEIVKKEDIVDIILGSPESNSSTAVCKLVSLPLVGILSYLVYSVPN